MNKQAIIYAFNCMTNILINFDHGIIPACTQEIKLSLNIHDVELGLLGSAVYAGLVLGSLVGSTIFSKIRTKKIVYLSVLCCMLSLGIFIVTKNIYLLFVSRFLVGFFQVCKFKILIFLVVFFPVWTDFYGGIYKTLGLTFMQLGVALGAVVGYLVTSLYVKYTGNWVYPYYLQIALLIPCLLFYTCICSDSDLDTQGNSEEQSILESSPSLRQQVKLLFNNPIFLCTMLALSSLFFVVTGIQFWISDYMRIILNLSQDFVFKAFLVISLTAPILGVFFGGLLLHFMGGYDGQNALKVVALEALLASCAGIPISYLNNVDAVLVLLWLLLFFGGSAVPAITGIMINSIPKDSKSTGNSISHLFQELLGYLPAPMIYGMVQRLTGGPESRYGMMVLTGWSLIGLFFILLCLKLNSQIQSTVNFDTELQILDSSEIKRNVDFSYIKRQTSLSEAKSSYKRSQSHDINQSPLYKKMHSQQLRKLSRKQTFSEAIQNIAHIIGRGSMEPMLIQEHRLLIPEGRVYLISKEVKNAHRQAFKEIFSMKAVEGKLDKRGLADLFVMIDYKIPQEQFDEMVQRIFGKKEQIGFEEFLKIFNLKLTDYTFNDVRNAFKLLAKDDDRYIPIEKIKKVLLKNAVPQDEVDFLCHQLDPFTDTMKRVNYQEFLKSLSNV